MPPLEISTLPELEAALDELYQGIERDCWECKDPDCMGFVWLLKQEMEKLYELGVPLLEVNDEITFIHSFPLTAEGKPNFAARYPPCSQLCADSRRCNIYKDRPLACHLYPLGFETKADGTIVWAVHLDCLYIRRMEERGLTPDFESRALSIINSITPQLLEEIVATYRAVDAISCFPYGENSYSTLQEVYRVKMQTRS